MSFSRIVATAAASLLIMILASSAVLAAEIVIFAPNGAKEALMEIVPMFERASGHKVNITYGSGPTWMEKIRAGATGDLLILADENSDPLLKEGKLVAGSRIAFAHSAIGVAVRAGAPKPDISTPEKFKSALLAAKSVAYSSAASGNVFVSAIERLGIANEIKAKRVAWQTGDPIGAVVARGAAEIGVHQISELLPIAGIEIVGPVPSELQTPIVFGASLLPMSKQREAAGEFVTFLRSPAAAPVIKKKGMDQV